MQYQVTKMLKCMISALFSNYNITPEQTIEDFFNRSELALRDEYKQDLLKHLKQYVP